MMILLFLMLLGCVIAEMFGKRKITIGLLIIVLIIACVWFHHHVTDHLNIDL